MGLVAHCVSLGPSLSPASLLSFRKGSGWAGKSEDPAWTVRAEGQETEGRRGGKEAGQVWVPGEFPGGDLVRCCRGAVPETQLVAPSV